MIRSRMLKPDLSIGGLWVPLAILAAAGVTWAVWGMGAAFMLMAGLVLLHALFSLSVYGRTRSSSYLIAFLYQLSLAAVIGSMGFSQEQALVEPNNLALVAMVGFGAWLVYLTASRRLKWRGREILELAALPVEKRGNGFTGRPRPAGQLSYDKESLHGYAHFMSRNLISLAYQEKNGMVLVPVMMGQEYKMLVNLRPDYSEATWVSFGYDGRVSANISREDYLRYEEDLAFDQLCQSLADLFIEFFELYQAGRETRIIDRLNALQMHVFA